MSVSWINVNQKLKEGIDLINTVKTSTFSLILNRIVENIEENELFTEEERSKLESSLTLQSSDVLLLLNSTKYILDKCCKFIIRPSVLATDLCNLSINEDKAELFVKAWTVQSKTLLIDLHGENKVRNQLEDVKWQLNLQVSSETEEKQKIPKAIIEFAITNDDVDAELVSLEMGHGQLLEFYNQLEDIQNTLDSLKK